MLDFMAPLFPVLVKRAGKEAKVEPWMMQKSMVKVKKSLASVNQQGDFLLLENNSLGSLKMSQMVTEKAHIQRGKLALDWFVKTPKKMPSPLQVTYKDAQPNGKSQLVTYSSFLINGSW